MKRVWYTLFLLLLTLLVITIQFGLSAAEQKESAGMVKIGKFYMDKYEYPNIIGQYPVTNVTWSEAKAMCEAEGKRLCTPEEWVLACRGPQGLRFPYGPVYDGTKCNSESPIDAPQAIGDTPKTCVSVYGVYDLNGNVWEWVGTSLEQEVSIRGGAWSSSSCAECALVFWENKPTTSSDRAGFRCCK